VLAQGSTPVNGPHQGALVDTPTGESWFLHFQDQGAYGRIVHLQPVRWENDWPLMGTGVATGAARGEPVLVHQLPGPPPQPCAATETSDEFASACLGLQWQWQANPGDNWYSLSARFGALRLFAQPEPRPGNLYDAPHLLMQKFPALEFVATTKVDLARKAAGDTAGLVVFGYDYAWLGWRQEGAGTELVLATCRDAAQGAPQEIMVAAAGPELPPWLRVSVREGARCQFSYSADGENFTDIGEVFTAAPGRWVGAKLGLFASCSPATAATGGHADFDWFRLQVR
jgi:beta-xylosidase